MRFELFSTQGVSFDSSSDYRIKTILMKLLYPIILLLLIVNGNAYSQVLIDDAGNIFEQYSKGGHHPMGDKLCEADNGKLYGMTRFGGKHDLGALIEFDPETGDWIKTIDFNGKGNGAKPVGGLIKGKGGKL